MENVRQLLNDEFKKRKGRNGHFSVRAFAKWLGMSPAQLSQMMTGKRPITVNSIKKISTRLGLSPVEKKALLASTFVDTKDTSTSKTLLLKEDEFRLISDWYHFAILSLAKSKDAKSDPRWIARRLGIDVETAHQALLRLSRMGIVEMQPRLRQICDPIAMVSDVPSAAIRQYHQNALELAIEKLETVPNHLREFQSISMNLDADQIAQFKTHIENFMNEMGEINDRSKGSEVFNLNVQLYPLTNLQKVNQ